MISKNILVLSIVATALVLLATVLIIIAVPNAMAENTAPEIWGVTPHEVVTTQLDDNENVVNIQSIQHFLDYGNQEIGCYDEEDGDRNMHTSYMIHPTNDKFFVVAQSCQDTENFHALVYFTVMVENSDTTAEKFQWYYVGHDDVE